MAVELETLPSTPPRHRHRWVIPVGFVWLMSVLLWFLAGGLLPQSDQVQVIGVAVVLSFLGMIGAAAMSGGLDVRTALARLKLGPWMGIGFSVGFGLATLVWLGDVRGYQGMVTRSSLVPAATVAGAGFISLALAYRSTPRLFRELGSNLDRHLRGGGTFFAGALSIWTLWGVAVSAYVMNFNRGTLGYLSDPAASLSTTSSANAVLSTLTQLGLLATIVAAWKFAADKRPGSMVLLMWVAGSQVVIGLFSGTKEAVIIQLIALVVGFSARGKLRLRPLVTAGLLVMFVVTPFVTAYRAAVLNGSGRLSPTESLQRIDFFELMSGSTSQNSQGDSLQESAARWSRIGDVAIIMRKTPAIIGYLSPVELIGGPVLGLVPRSVWPEKPILDAGYEVNKQYYEVPGNIYNSVSLTTYGDLYRHGGVWVVIVGMAILGMFVRAVDDRRGAGSDIDPRLLFLPMLLFTALVKQEIDYLALTASLVSIILAAAVATRMVSRRLIPHP